MALELFAVLAWAGQCLLGEPTYGAPVTPPFATFPLRIAVATEAGEPVADSTWLAGEIDTAQTMFAPFGVQFARTPGKDEGNLDPKLNHILTRADRDALATATVPSVINVFVVASLEDVDEPGRMRKGVHWHVHSGTHYVILVAASPLSVLAHELGHFFGNPHSPVVDNVMSYERSGGWVFFDAVQGARIVSHARAYLESGELRPATP